VQREFYKPTFALGVRINPSLKWNVRRRPGRPRSGRPRLPPHHHRGDAADVVGLLTGSKYQDGGPRPRTHVTSARVPGRWQGHLTGAVVGRMIRAVRGAIRAVSRGLRGGGDGGRNRSSDYCLHRSYRL